MEGGEEGEWRGGRDERMEGGRVTWEGGGERELR
jgi:hypothetical protein